MIQGEGAPADAAEALHGTERYTDTVPLPQEVPAARAAQQQAGRLVGLAVLGLRAGERDAAVVLRPAAAPIVDSLLRNPDAFFWVSSLQRRDSYLCSHAVNVAGMAAALGRHMGLPRAALEQLALGGLLLDLGKCEFPDSLLDAPSALDRETALMMQQHVEAGVAIAQAAGIEDPLVLDMLRGHHERWDGSGYPAGLRGAEIPLSARIGAIVDSYDAMISERAYRSPTSRHAALQELYHGHDRLYQRELVEQFLQCMSIYPTGSLVELNTGQVGIVVAQNNARRLHPRVMLLLDASKTLYARHPVIDLLAHNEANPAAPVDVVASLEPGEYDLDPTALYLA